MKNSQHVGILVAEDDYLSAQQIKDAIAQTEFSLVGEARDGLEAVKLTVSLHPDVILMDIKMSPMSGIEAARQIQHLCPTPIIILTAYQNQQFIEDASKAGVLAYLKKPLSQHDLTRTLPIAQARFDELVSLRHVTDQLHTELSQLKQGKIPSLDQQLIDEEIERQVRERTEELLHINTALRAELASYTDAQEKLLEPEAAVNVFLEANMNANIMVDAQGRIVLFNPAAEDLFGYSADEVRYQPIRILLRDQVAALHQTRLEGFLEKGVGRCGHIGRRMEFVFRRKDGTLFDAEMSMAGGRSNGHRFLVASVHDITERKQAQQQIQAVLEEKQHLVREAYHRTKNNMNSIVNLLRLQASHIKNSEALKFCKAIEHRVQAMLLVQKRLYQADDVRCIDLKSYFEELAYVICGNLSVNPAMITLKLKLERIVVSSDTAVVCGLVLNELMTNSLKYAFPENRSGEITLQLHSLKDKSIELRFSDNGIGLPTDFDISQTESLGLQLVSLFIKQELRGNFTFTGDSGAEFIITLPATLNTTDQ